MLERKGSSIYFIPGGGFKSDIFKYSSLFKLNGVCLEYAHLQQGSISEGADYLAGFIKNDAALIAWSMGGVFAIYLAHLFPGKVKNLILLASQAKFLSGALSPGVSCEKAIDFIRRAKRDISIGWVANCLDPTMLAVQENIAALSQWVPAPCVATIPFQSGDILTPIEFAYL